MSQTKTVQTRIQQKHGIEANWLKAINFVPMAGELIIYDAETQETFNEAYKKLTDEQKKTFGRTSPILHARFKFGDGLTTVSELPFVKEDLSSYATKIELAELEEELSNINVVDYTAATDSLITINGKTIGTKYITPGSAESSVEVFDGKVTNTNAKYAIAIGTNDKTPIKGILGDIAANQITVNKPLADAVGSIAFGGGAETKSTGGQALGVLNTSGVKGYYWDEIDFTNKTITITSTRRASTYSKPTAASSLDWQVGDTISLVNNNQYAACAKITAISGNKITVDQLPFTSISYDSKLSVYTYVSPDDRTIFACYQKEEANFTISALNVSIVNKRWYPRNGVVELGWAGTAFGVENLVTGSGALVAGFNNWQAGNFGVTAGRDNVGGFCGITVGGWNKNYGWHSAVLGRDLVNNGDYNLLSGRTNTINNIAGKDPSSHNNIGGSDNTVSGHRNIVGGSSNTLSAGYNSLITGTKTTATDFQSSIAIGDSHVVKGNNQAIFGLGHEIISGSCNFISGRKNIISGNSNTVIGGAYDGSSSGNSVYGIGNIVGGTNNKAGAEGANVNFSFITGANNVASHVYTYVLGRELKTSSSYQLVIGSNNAEVANAAFIVGVGGLGGTSKNGFVVHKDGRATVGKAPTNDFDVATKAYVDAHSGGSGIDETTIQEYMERTLLNGEW